MRNLEVAGLHAGDLPDDSTGVLHVLYAEENVCKVEQDRRTCNLWMHIMPVDAP